MATSPVVTGARAKVRIYDSVTGKPKVIGLVSNCTWSIRQDKTPIFILGRYNPASIVSTAQEAVSLRLTGFRIYGLGPYVTMNATKLMDLLNENDFTVDIIDRKNPSVALFTAVGCLVQGWSSGVNSRGISDISVDVIGQTGWDESTPSGGDDDTGAGGGEAAANLLDD